MITTKQAFGESEAELQRKQGSEEQWIEHLENCSGCSLCEM